MIVAGFWLFAIYVAFVLFLLYAFGAWGLAIAVALILLIPRRFQ